MKLLPLLLLLLGCADHRPPLRPYDIATIQYVPFIRVGEGTYGPGYIYEIRDKGGRQLSFKTNQLRESPVCVRDYGDQFLIEDCPKEN